MTRRLFLIFALAIAPAFASHPPSSRHRVKCEDCARDSRGKIQRSRAATRDFQRSHPCPSTGKTSGACPGWVKDHIDPLKKGGADAPSNIQWQTKADAAKKDKIE